LTGCGTLSSLWRPKQHTIALHVLLPSAAAYGLARGGVRGVWAGSRWRARRMGWLAAECAARGLARGGVQDRASAIRAPDRRVVLPRWGWTCEPSALDDRDHRCGKLARTSGCWRTWSDTADPMSNYGQHSNQVSEREWDRPARNEAPGSREVGGSMGGHRSAEVAGLRRSRVCGGAGLWTIAVRAVAGLQRAGSAGGHGVAEAAGL
jgi:hypothetical protein